LVQSAGTEETLSYDALKSATLANRRKLRPRQQQSRVQQPNAWLALHPSGTHGEALPEYRRQASAMDAIDAAIALLGQPVSSLQVAAQEGPNHDAIVVGLAVNVFMLMSG